MKTEGPFGKFIEEMRAKGVVEEPEFDGHPDDEPQMEDEPEDDLPPRPDFEYIGGGAGTGKSFMAKDLAARLGSLLTATTGIAAVNLGGTTINSALGYYDTASMAEAFTHGWLQHRMYELAEDCGVWRYILDEVSMLDAEQLTILCATIDEVNERLVALADGDDRAKIGLTLVGDFAQLPPVKAKFAFESPEWRRFVGNTTILQRVWRQEAPDFVAALNSVRRGEGKAALEFFEPHLQEMNDRKFAGTTVMARNEEVDRYNQLQLSSCPGKDVVVESVRVGKQRGEWKHIPEKLELREGALVMVLANKKSRKTGDYVYVNGDLGTLVAKEPIPNPYSPETAEPVGYRVLVDLHRTKMTTSIEMVTRQNIIPLEPGRTKALRAEGKEDLIKGKSEVVGSITYMPLRLAWATTVHKSQGLSLDKVQINIRDHFFMTGGMLYVALSRARTIGGLRLVGTAEQFLTRCRPDARVKSWL